MLSGAAAVAAGKETALRMHDAGASIDEIAYHFNAHPQIVARYLREWTKVQKPKDYSKKNTPAQRSNGGKNSACVRALERAIETGEVDRMRNEGESMSSIAVQFGVAHVTVSEKLRNTPRRKEALSREHLVPGKRYGNLTFEKVVEGARRKWQFKHRCGWRVTYIEPQLREADLT